MIELLNGYYCDVTAYSYNLVRKIPGRTVKTIRKDGTVDIRDATEVISYHHDLAAVINAAMREMQKNKLRSYNENISLRSALNEIESIYEVFEELLKATVGKYDKVERKEDTSEWKQIEMDFSAL